MLYRILEKIIERGQKEGLAEKIDIFYATGKITTEEYETLNELMKAGA